jgi:hypothetical protein
MSHKLLNDIFEHFKEHIQSGKYDLKDVIQAHELGKVLKGGKLTPEQVKQKRIEANRKYYLKKRSNRATTTTSTPAPAPAPAQNNDDDEFQHVDRNKVLLLENMLNELKYIKQEDLKKMVDNIKEANPSLNIKYNKKNKETLIDIIIKYKINKL